MAFLTGLPVSRINYIGLQSELRKYDNLLTKSILTMIVEQPRLHRAFLFLSDFIPIFLTSFLYFCKL